MFFGPFDLCWGRGVRPQSSVILAEEQSTEGRALLLGEHHAEYQSTETKLSLPEYSECDFGVPRACILFT